MASIFDDILLKGVRKGQIPARTQSAREWFRKKARETRNARVYPDNLLKEVETLSNEVKPGRMYHFKYDAKHKETLPYFDRFPLIFMVGPAKGGFYGINLHYLPPKLRALMMDALYEVANNERYDESTKLRLTYNMLKKTSKMKYYKPCFKHYLSKQVGSRFIGISSADWDTALFLPTERFVGASKSRVYADSRRILK